MNMNDIRADAYRNSAVPFRPAEFEHKGGESGGRKENSPENTASGRKKSSAPVPPASESASPAAEAVRHLKSGGLIKVTGTSSGGKDSIYRRVAKFLLLIGEDEAAKILPHLSEEQISRIVPEIATIRSVSPDEASVILAEFNSLLEKSRHSGGVDTAREILEKAYGKKRADEMLSKAVPFAGGKPFEYLSSADPDRIYRLVKDESMGIKAIVLSYLEPKKAADVINMMSPEEKSATVLRLAKMEPVRPDVIRRIDQAMHEKSLSVAAERAENIDGRNALAQILKKMSPSAENEILSSLSDDDPELGEDLRSRLFTADDVVNADDRFIQDQLRGMTDDDICFLLAGKNDAFRAKILDNVSSGRRGGILEREEILRPVRRADGERVTSYFFSVLRRAFDDGHLIIKGRTDDIYV